MFTRSRHLHAHAHDAHVRSQSPWLAVLGLAALFGLGFRKMFDVHDLRRSTRLRTAPEHLQTWEGEGGGVPVGTHRTAAQVQPAPPADPRTDLTGGL